MGQLGHNPPLIMNSFKVFSFLLVVGLSQSAPQISQQGVVGQVLGQLQPAIARTLAEILGSRSSSTVGLGQGVNGAIRSTSSGFGQGVTGAVKKSSVGFGQGATGAVSTISFGQGATGAVRTTNVGSSRVSSTSSQSGLSASQLTSSVVASLQPSIAAAVAKALSASSSSRLTSTSAVTSSASTLSEEEEARLNAQQSANAQYEYGYKVADDETQSYMSHEETRNGQDVEGKYNYVDANGALVTVSYQAGPEGYTENREVQDGAVEMRTTYGPWEGPFADTVPAGVSSAAADVSQSQE